MTADVEHETDYEMLERLGTDGAKWAAERLEVERQISDEVCLAALRGWNGWAPDADLSKVQTVPETKAAWRRAISAALVALSDEQSAKPSIMDVESDVAD